MGEMKLVQPGFKDKDLDKFKYEFLGAPTEGDELLPLLEVKEIHLIVLSTELVGVFQEGGQLCSHLLSLCGIKEGDFYNQDWKKASVEGFGGCRSWRGRQCAMTREFMVCKTEVSLPVTLLSRQAEASLAEQHSLMTFSDASYSLPRKTSGTLVCLRDSSNMYLKWGSENKLIFSIGCAC